MVERDRSEQSPVEAFAAQYRADERAGVERSLREYLELFPGDDLGLAREFAALRGAPEAEEVGGDRIGSYRLLRELGRGGQGAVWLAEDTRLARRVALKVLSGAGPGVGSHLTRFRREAAIAARLNHPGICSVFDTGVTSGLAWIAMELVEGETLARRIALASTSDEETLSDRTDVLGADEVSDESASRRPQGAGTGGREPSRPRSQDQLRRIARLVEDAARALHAAHEAGVLHRDVKPGNLMVTPEDRVVVLDFGLARDEEGGEVGLTQSGDLMGTPAYMSPEQIAAQRVPLDRRTDVYSLGVVLFEFLALRRPFEAATRQGLYQAILTKDAPDLRKVNRFVPDDLRVICETALEKDRDRRYQTALELAEDLRRFREREPIHARPITRWVRVTRWVQRNPGVAASLLLALVILVAGTTVSSVQAVRARSSAAQARKNEGEARSNLRQWRRMADVRLLKDLQREADAELWPAWPEKVPAMDRWLARARGLSDRLADHERILAALRAKAPTLTEAETQRDRESHPRYPELMELLEKQDALPREIATLTERVTELEEQAERNPQAELLLEQTELDLEKRTEELDGLQDRLDPMEKAVGERGTWNFPDEEDRYQHEVYSDLVSGTQKLVGEGGLKDDVTERRAVASTIGERSLDDEAGGWEAAVARVAKDARFKGFRLTPQMGLVPLGPDPASKLEEFWVCDVTGERPERTGGGALLITDTTGVVLVLIPGGTFTMGCQPDDPDQPNYDPGCRATERPPHPVTLAPYFLAKYELTQHQWSRLAGENASFWRPETEGFAISVRHPVENVSWNDCERILPRAGLALPTEAQWERACRATTDTVYWCGATIATIGASSAGNVADKTADAYGATWTCTLELEDGHVVHAPVGSFAPNPYGLHDVLGNVWEWCRDGYDERAYDREARAGDGLRSIWNPRSRVYRGGSFQGPAENARSALRFRYTPSARNFVLGVRPARAHHP